MALYRAVFWRKSDFISPSQGKLLAVFEQLLKRDFHEVYGPSNGVELVGQVPLRSAPLQTGFSSAPLQRDTPPARRASRLSAPGSRCAFRSAKPGEFTQVLLKPECAAGPVSVSHTPAFRGKPVGPPRRRNGAWL